MANRLNGKDDGAAEAWSAEISKRAQDILGGRVQTIDGEEAHEMLRARLRSLRGE